MYKNKEDAVAYDKRYYKEHKEEKKIKERGRVRNRGEYLKSYSVKNRENINKKRNIRANTRRRTDLKFNLIDKMHSMLNHSLKGNKNGLHWEKIVGYKLNDLIKRLKKTMPIGCTWKDFLKGKLHIDHIIPIRAFVFKNPEDEELKQCWSLDNLRLLDCNENILKNDSINNPILLGLILKNCRQ